MRTSEWASLGHPDKMADYISQYVLDRYFEDDADARYAIEVMVKDNTVILAGEVAARRTASMSAIDSWVREAVAEVGYNAEYKGKWGNYAVCADDLIVECMFRNQSPDIAAGVDSGGWGDQGIFWGMATSNPRTSRMPEDIYLARAVGQALYESGVCGLDVKTLVSMDGYYDVARLVVAAPVLDDEAECAVRALAVDVCKAEGFGEPKELVVNGTGEYTYHSSIADCGVTGRKLVADLYGGNCETGGGSPWTKDWTKADLTLNLYARKMAVERIGGYAAEKPWLEAVKCKLSCCIGRPFVDFEVLDAKTNESLETGMLHLPPRYAAAELGLLSGKPMFADICRMGLPYVFS
jgi:S-adenosylmethionine synthetase